MYDVELAKPKVGHNEPVFVGLFVLQFAKQRMCVLFCNLSVSSVILTISSKRKMMRIFCMLHCRKRLDQLYKTADERRMEENAMSFL